MGECTQVWASSTNNDPRDYDCQQCTRTCSICRESNLQQQFTNCTYCNANIHHHCSQTNAAALQLQTPVCTTCINGSQTNRHINNCFICNTDEGKLLVCQQCVRLSHKPCIDKLRIPVTDDTFLCPWCMPATPLEQQPTHRHTDSDDGEGNDQHDEPIQKDTAATEPPQQQQQTSDTQTTETQKRDTKKPTKTNQTTSHKCKTARRGTLKCTYCKKTIGNQLAHNCQTQKCENKIHCACKEEWFAKTQTDPTHNYLCPRCTKASTTKTTKKHKQRQISPSPPSDPPYALRMCCLPATITEGRKQHSQV